MGGFQVVHHPSNLGDGSDQFEYGFPVVLVLELALQDN
ncbi:MAG: hypothetical protein ACI80V_001898 [Rhodothermales bacterium]